MKQKIEWLKERIRHTGHVPHEHGDKPLLRGWSHALASVGAVIVTLGLLVQTYNDLPRFVSLLIFGLSMILLYVISSTYHLMNWRGKSYRLMTALDHANIFLFIAGAYTPICVNLLAGWQRIVILGVVWLLAAVGVGCSAFALRTPRWIMASMYISMGWISVFLLPQVAGILSLQPVLLLLGGGVLYTIGAVIYTLRWPDPLPRIFGFHELFHLLVIGGTVAVTMTIWIWIVPSPRS